MDTIQDLSSARQTVAELCCEDTSDMQPPQLLTVLDAHISRARSGGDGQTASVLLAVRRSLRSKAESLH